MYSDLTFKKSTYSNSASCIEVAIADREFFVRDSKDPGGPVLHFTLAEWRTFLARTAADQVYG